LSKVVKTFLQTGHFFSIQITLSIDRCSDGKTFLHKVRFSHYEIQLKKPKYAFLHVSALELLMSKGEPETTSNPEVEMKLSHELYLRAVNNPLRRKILEALTRGAATIEDLEAKTNLDEATLKWHLNVLESGLCIEKENKQGNLTYKLTKFGKVVDYLK